MEVFNFVVQDPSQKAILKFFVMPDKGTLTMDYQASNEKEHNLVNKLQKMLGSLVVESSLKDDISRMKVRTSIKGLTKCFNGAGLVCRRNNGQLF